MLHQTLDLMLGSLYTDCTVTKCTQKKVQSIVHGIDHLFVSNIKKKKSRKCLCF